MNALELLTTPELRNHPAVLEWLEEESDDD
jgi:hypothetical protein